MTLLLLLHAGANAKSSSSSSSGGSSSASTTSDVNINRQKYLQWKLKKIRKKKNAEKKGKRIYISPFDTR